MAIFHASLKVFSRSRGHSATAAAAYRAGCVITDDRTGLRHDYTRRSGVESVRVMVPVSAPKWAHDTAALWNQAELFETRTNAKVARELEVGLPAELSGSQRAALAADIGQALVERYGVAAMVALHAPDERSDSRNFHAHILFTTRALAEGGFGEKVRALDGLKEGPKEVEVLRRCVADLTNQHLAAAGLPDRVDHRTLRAQARAAEEAGDHDRAAVLTREPTVHEGKATTAAKRRGQPMERALENITRRRDNDIALADHRTRLARGPSTKVGDLVAIGPQPKDLRRAIRGVRAARSTQPAGTNVLSGPVRVARAGGQDAALLNAQATLAEQSGLAAREGAQAYLDGARRAVEQHRVLVEKYVQAVGLSASEAVVLLQHCARDRWCAALLRQALEMREALVLLRDEVPARRRSYGVAMKRTADERRAFETLEESAPSLWRPLTRRQWAERRREQRSRVADAESAERIARKACGIAATDDVKAQARALRSEIRGIEHERRRLFPTRTCNTTARIKYECAEEPKSHGDEAHLEESVRPPRSRRRPH